MTVSILLELHAKSDLVSVGRSTAGIDTMAVGSTPGRETISIDIRFMNFKTLTDSIIIGALRAVEPLAVICGKGMAVCADSP